ncbi:MULTISPECIES: hypothetical protein [unclassified Sphingomonas]|uniref:hypothetical protein n=1 Tax=unclassified Sphingomonas TaxID=196159 RepID=UPI0035A945D3
MTPIALLGFVRSLFSMPQRIDRATFLALAALYRVAEQSADATTCPSIALRAILAGLHAKSGGERDCYDAFWKAATMQDGDAYSESIGDYQRRTACVTAWNRIVRQLGIVADMEFQAAIYKAAR